MKRLNIQNSLFKLVAHSYVQLKIAMKRVEILTRESDVEMNKSLNLSREPRKAVANQSSD